MDPDQSEPIVEILDEIFQNVEEEILDLTEFIPEAQSSSDDEEAAEVPELVENVEQDQEDNYFPEASCSLSNQNEENKRDTKKRLSELFVEENIFLNGSRYSGTWNPVGMAGFGRYVFPHGAVYEGEFRDDKFHGHGAMLWPCGQTLDGVWANGLLKMRRYRFKDGLEYVEHDWKYCRFPDRRFYNCITSTLRPARITLKTNCQPTKIIPVRTYDAGNGIYDPDTYCIMSYDSTKIIEIPTESRVNWIKNHCRKGSDRPTGYRPCLNENWLKKKGRRLNIPYCLALSKDSPQNWWQRLSTFEHDNSIYHKEDYTCKNCYLRRKKGEAHV